MAPRSKAKYQLHTDGVENDTLVPPLIFHTLIENALTHLAAPERNLDFFIEQDNSSSEMKLRFSCDSSGEISEHIGTGTGTRYLEARLEDAFPDKWNLSQIESNGKWVVDIVVQT